MDKVQITNGATVVAQSRNLRGILDYARKSYVRTASCYRNQDGSGFLAVTFDDGAMCRTKFADYSVLLDWLRARRSWALDEICCGNNLTTFTILCGDSRY